MNESPADLVIEIASPDMIACVDVDRPRLEELFTAHAAAVRAYALRRTDPTAADDVVMEVFVVACRRLDAIPSDPLPWLLACARRVLANQRRTVRRADALVLRIGSTLDGVPIEADASERLELALSTLRDSDREVLLLNAWEDLMGPPSAPCSVARARPRASACTGRAGGWRWRTRGPERPRPATITTWRWPDDRPDATAHRGQPGHRVPRPGLRPAAAASRTRAE